MNFPGPISLPSVSIPNQEVSLRLFQRVTAPVLAVTGATALLAIDGYPVVAQLTSSEQAASLLAQRTAQFIVTQLKDQKVILKLIKNDQPQGPLTGSVFNGPELAVRLLEQHGIPVTVSTLLMARSVLKQHLPLTSRLLNDMLSTLSEHGVWGEAEADLAAALTAAGLPVNAESLALASRQVGKVSDSIARLIALLTNASEHDLPSEIRRLLDSNLHLLNTLVLNADGDTSQLAEQLKAAVETLGRSLENILLESSQNTETPSSERSLLSLVRLQQMLEQAGRNELAGAIEEFLGDLRLNQFLNTKTDLIQRLDEWSEFDFAIQSAQQQAEREYPSARLRIARESGSHSNKINPANTRLILQVDLEPGETVEVDLSIVDKQVRTRVTAADPVWCQNAQAELPTLEVGLQGLGYILKGGEIIVGKPKQNKRLPESTVGRPLMVVDIEV
jgi:hypothetical protein